MGNGDIRSKLGKWLDQWERAPRRPEERIKPKHEPQNPSARAALLRDRRASARARWPLYYVSKEA